MTMSDAFELSAELREDKGKGASRRLRRLADQIPAIIYGGNKDPQPLTLIRKDLEKALENEAFYSHVLTISVGGDAQKAILKDLQRHPAKDSVMHADFLRVDDKTVVKVNIPIHFLNEESCVGVKMEGGSAVSAWRHPRVHRGGYVGSGNWPDHPPVRHRTAGECDLSGAVSG
jgi:large subunit ribosomal protein L25